MPNPIFLKESLFLRAWINHGATVDAPSEQDSGDGASPTASIGMDAEASGKRKGLSMP